MLYPMSWSCSVSDVIQEATGSRGSRRTIPLMSINKFNINMPIQILHEANVLIVSKINCNVILTHQ
jgi:hypothetical protein